MTAKAATRLAIDISPEFRDELKIQAIAHGKTLKDYVIEALMDRIQRDSVEEDKLWAQMSETAKGDGVTAGDDSFGILNTVNNA